MSLRKLAGLAVLALALGGCGSDKKIFVPLEVVVQGVRPGGVVDPVPEIQQFTSDIGFKFRIDQFYLAIQSVALQPCDAGDAGENGIIQSEGVATLLNSSEAPLDFGTYEVAPGDYCYLRVNLGPAGSTPSDAPEGTDISGTSVFYTGQVTPPAGLPGVPPITRNIEAGSCVNYSYLIPIAGDDRRISEEPGHTTSLRLVFDLVTAYNNYNPGPGILPLDSAPVECSLAETFTLPGSGLWTIEATRSEQEVEAPPAE